MKVADMSHAAQGVLQTVDQRDKLLHPSVAHRNRAATYLPGCLNYLKKKIVSRLL